MEILQKNNELVSLYDDYIVNLKEYVSTKAFPNFIELMQTMYQNY